MTIRGARQLHVGLDLRRLSGIRGAGASRDPHDTRRLRHGDTRVAAAIPRRLRTDGGGDRATSRSSPGDRIAIRRTRAGCWASPRGRPFVLASFGAYGAPLPYDAVRASGQFTLLTGRATSRRMASSTRIWSRRPTSSSASPATASCRNASRTTRRCCTRRAAISSSTTCSSPRCRASLRCRFISQEDLLAGRWAEAIASLLAQPGPPERARVDGAEVAAGISLSADSLLSTDQPSSRCYTPRVVIVVGPRRPDGPAQHLPPPAPPRARGRHSGGCASSSSARLRWSRPAWRSRSASSICRCVRRGGRICGRSSCWASATGSFRSPPLSHWLSRRARGPLPFDERSLFGESLTWPQRIGRLALLVLGFSVLTAALTWPQVRHLDSGARRGRPALFHLAHRVGQPSDRARSAPAVRREHVLSRAAHAHLFRFGHRSCVDERAAFLDGRPSGADLQPAAAVGIRVLRRDDVPARPRADGPDRRGASSPGRSSRCIRTATSITRTSSW